MNYREDDLISDWDTEILSDSSDNEGLPSWPTVGEDRGAAARLRREEEERVRRREQMRREEEELNRRQEQMRREQMRREEEEERVRRTRLRAEEESRQMRLREEQLAREERTRIAQLERETEERKKRERVELQRLQAEQVIPGTEDRAYSSYAAVGMAYTASSSRAKDQIFAVAEALSTMRDLPDTAEAYAGVLERFVEILRTEDEGAEERFDPEYARSIRKLKDGTPWQSISVRSGGASLRPPRCTPTVRGVVVGAFFDSNQDVMLQLACDVCAVTHKSPVSIAACATAAFCTALALERVHPERWPSLVARNAGPAVRRWIARYPFYKPDEHALLLDAFFTSFEDLAVSRSRDEDVGTEPACIQAAYRALASGRPDGRDDPDGFSRSIATAWETALRPVRRGHVSGVSQALQSLLDALVRTRSSSRNISRQRFAPATLHPTTRTSYRPDEGWGRGPARAPAQAPAQPPAPYRGAVRDWVEPSAAAADRRSSRDRDRDRDRVEPAAAAADRRSSRDRDRDRHPSPSPPPPPNARRSRGDEEESARADRERVRPPVAPREGTSSRARMMDKKRKEEDAMDSVQETIRSVKDPQLSQQLQLVHNLLRTADQRAASSSSSSSAAARGRRR